VSSVEVIKPLTAQECRIAAERAHSYPNGYGFRFLAKPVTAEIINFLDQIDPFIRTAATIAWLTVHPEDEALGCPAVAVASVRGELTPSDLMRTFYAVAAVFDNVHEYCLELNYDGAAIAAKLLEAATKLEQQEAAAKACVTNKEHQDGTDN
jgi:hypothetical protein